MRAAAKPHGPVGLIQFDTHTDTWPDVLGAELSHGTPMFRLVEAGVVDPARYVQIGIRGYTHDEEVWAWQRSAASRPTRCTRSTTAASTPSSPTRSR